MRLVEVFCEICESSDPVFLFNRDTHFLFDVLTELDVINSELGDGTVRIHKTGSKLYHMSPNDLVDYAKVFLQTGSSWEVEVFAAISPYLLEAAQRFYVDKYKTYKRKLRTKLIFKTGDDEYSLEDISLSKLFGVFAEPFELFRKIDAEDLRGE